MEPGGAPQKRRKIPQFADVDAAVEAGLWENRSSFHDAAYCVLQNAHDIPRGDHAKAIVKSAAARVHARVKMGRRALSAGGGDRGLCLQPLGPHVAPVLVPVPIPVPVFAAYHGVAPSALALPPAPHSWPTAQTPTVCWHHQLGAPFPAAVGHCGNEATPMTRPQAPAVSSTPETPEPAAGVLVGGVRAAEAVRHEAVEHDAVDDGAAPELGDLGVRTAPAEACENSLAVVV